MLLFVCTENTESKLVKLKTSHTVILPPYGECSLAQVITLVIVLRKLGP